MIENSGLKLPKKDLRDFRYAEMFGAIDAADLLNTEFDYSKHPVIKDQGPSDLCTAFSTASLMEETEEVELAPEYLFAKTKQIEGTYLSFGADPKNVLKALKEKGMLERKVCPQKYDPSQGQVSRNKVADWKNYPLYLDDAAKIHRCGSYFTPSGYRELFDSIRNIIQIERVGLVAGVYWQPEWQGAVIPKEGPYKKVNPHQVYIRPAQKILPGESEPRLVIQNSYGPGFGDNGLFYFPREVVNKFLFSYVVLDADPNEVKKETWSLLDHIYHQLMVLFAKLNTPKPPVPLVPIDQTPPPPVEPKPVVRLTPLVQAIIQVESNGNDMAIGDLALKHRAYGPMQIRQPACDDVNRRFDTNYKAQDCLGDRKLSIDIFEKYMGIYATSLRLGRPVTDEDRARIWNAGPAGWRKDGTRRDVLATSYWNKVKKFLT